MTPIIIYCYDAYCGWCYGFSEEIQKIENYYKNILDFEVLSGGMLIDENKMPIEKIAPYIKNEFKNIQKKTGVQFGKDFLWHILNYQNSDWILNSEKPAIALCIFKDIYPHNQLHFAALLQNALYVQGRDLDDDQAYNHILEQFDINANDFFLNLKSTKFKEMARYEFDLCKQMKVYSYPTVLLQINENKIYTISNGYTTFNDLKPKINAIISQLKHV